MKVYLEVGEKKVFAVALDWIGFARWGKTEEAALATLAQYVPRYRASVGDLAKDLKAPKSVRDLEIVDRLPGNKTTDFGAPAAIIKSDRAHRSDKEFEAGIAQLRRGWDAFADATKEPRARTWSFGPTRRRTITGEDGRSRSRSGRGLQQRDRARLEACRCSVGEGPGQLHRRGPSCATPASCPMLDHAAVIVGRRFSRSVAQRGIRSITRGSWRTGSPRRPRRPAPSRTRRRCTRRARPRLQAPPVRPQRSPLADAARALPRGPTHSIAAPAEAAVRPRASRRQPAKATSTRSRTRRCASHHVDRLHGPSEGRDCRAGRRADEPTTNARTGARTAKARTARCGRMPPCRTELHFVTSGQILFQRAARSFSPLRARSRANRRLRPTSSTS